LFFFLFFWTHARIGINSPSTRGRRCEVGLFPHGPRDLVPACGG
jgi:hypothetical protein